MHSIGSSAVRLKRMNGMEQGLQEVYGARTEALDRKAGSLCRGASGSYS